MAVKAPTWRGPACPQDPEHGPMFDWPTATAAFYCPHARHTGNPFYRTDLSPAPRSAALPDSTATGGRVRGDTDEPSSRVPEARSEDPIGAFPRVDRVLTTQQRHFCDRVQVGDPAECWPWPGSVSMDTIKDVVRGRTWRHLPLSPRAVGVLST